MNGITRNSVRREYQHSSDRFKIAKLAGIMAVPFGPNESGLLHQTANFELDPVAGHMRSDMFAKVSLLFIPFQCIRQCMLPDDPTAGITEVIRQIAMDRAPLLPTELEGESDITKMMNIVPMSVSGAKRLSPVARIAYNAAVNYLRKSRYIYATEVAYSNGSLTPAIIEETVLDKFNAALNPDEHINGNVKLRLSKTDAPLKGFTQWNNQNATVGDAKFTAAATGITVQGSASGFTIKRKTGNPAGTELDVWADLSDVAAEGISLVDLYNAERADKLVRSMAALYEKDPWNGEESILRWVLGLKTDTGQQPFVLYENRVRIADLRKNATDAVGLQDEVMMSYHLSQFDYKIPVPATELGGIVVTLAQVTPDETLQMQPHPILSRPWEVPNYAAESMLLDPELVVAREVQADIALQADETDPLFYTGRNELKRNYVRIGFSRGVDLETVDSKTVMYQYAIPAGVTPDNILYPANFSQYPFLDQNADVVEFGIISRATINTPLFFGPSPVEKLDIIDDEDLFGDEE